MAYGADGPLAPLYPAMPYTSFHAITRADSDALFAYFMSLPAVEQPATPNEVSFPFDIRPLMFGWNLLFAEPPTVRDGSGQGRGLEPGRLSRRGARSLRRMPHAAQRARRHGGGQGARPGRSSASSRRRISRRVGSPRAAGTATISSCSSRPGRVRKGPRSATCFWRSRTRCAYLTDDDRMAIATYLMDVDASAPSKGDAAVASLGDEAA